jgi:hypothetical protein
MINDVTLHLCEGELMKLKKQLTLVLLVGMLLAALPAPLWAANAPTTDGTTTAQGAASPVTYDAPAEGAIDSQAVTQDWSLTTQGADRIQIRVERLDGNLVPDVALLDNLGQSLTESYGATETYDAAIINDYTLPQANTFTIQVSRDGGADGLTSGRYRLTVTALGLGEDHPDITTPTGPIQMDTPLTGEITLSRWSQTYVLDGEEGDYVGVNEERTSGSLIAELELLDSNGQSVAWGYRSTFDNTSQISGTQLPYTGQYQLVVRREGGISGGSTGGYSLTAVLLGSNENSARFTSATPGVIAQYNSPVTGTITGANWHQDWQFMTLAADTVTITVQRSPEYTLETPNLLRPVVVLLDASNTVLYQGYPDYTGTSSEISRYRLPAAGTYTVRVSRESDINGVTTGDYALTVTLDGTGADSADLAAPVGTLAVGTPATGQIDAVRWSQAWTFSGQEGQEITFTVTRTSGNYVPYIEILDSNGVSQYSAYPEYTYDTATIENFRLGYTGDFQIVVSRDRGQDGISTGGYSLTATAAAQ